MARLALLFALSVALVLAMPLPAHAEPATIAIAIVTAAQSIGVTLSVAIVTTAVSAVYSLAATMLINALISSGKSSPSGSSPDNSIRGAQMVRSPVKPQQAIYGEAVVSGPIIYSTVTANKYEIWIVIALSERKLNAITDIAIGDTWIPSANIDSDGWVRWGRFKGQGQITRFLDAFVPTTAPFTITLPNPLPNEVLQAEYTVASMNATVAVNDGPSLPAEVFNFGPPTTNVLTFSDVYAGRQVQIQYTVLLTNSVLQIKRITGDDNQVADLDLIAASGGEWTANHRGQGTAHLIVRMLGSINAFPNGVENIRAKVKGFNVYDPRDGVTKYSDNAALCLADYLRSNDGFRSPIDEIKTDQWIAAANIADEAITLNLLGETQKRYTINGAFSVDSDRTQIKDQMAASMGGWCPWIQGRWHIIPGAFAAPVMSLDEHTLNGVLTVTSAPGARDRLNTVAGTFLDAKGDYQANAYPPVSSPLYVGEDGGEELVTERNFVFLTESLRSQRIAKIILERSRQSISVLWPTHLIGLALTPGDIVTLTVAYLGWSLKTFRVIEWKFTLESGVTLNLQEDTAQSYDWNYGQATLRDPAPNTNIGPAVPGPIVGLAATSGNADLIRLGDGTILPRVRITWDPIDNNFVLDGGKVEVHYRRPSEVAWTESAPATPTERQTFLSPVQDGEALFIRARAVNHINQYGPYVYIVHEVMGKTAPPDDVTGFTLTILPDGTRQFDVNWSTIVDVAGLEIRYGPTNSWATMTSLTPGSYFTSTPIFTVLPPPGTYVFAAKWIDTSGIASVTQATIGPVVIGTAFSVFAQGSGANMYPNAALALPWTATGGQYLYSINQFTDASIDVGRLDVTFRVGDGGVYFYSSGETGGYGQLFFTRAGVQLYGIAAGFPVLAGRRYQAAVEMGVSRRSVSLNMAWYDAGFSLLSSSNGPSVTPAENKTGGTTLAHYKRLAMFGTAPANAVYMMPYIQVTPRSSGTDSIARMQQMLIAEAGLGQVEVSPWSPGPSYTGIIDTGQLAPESATRTASAKLATQIALVNTSNPGGGSFTTVLTQTIAIAPNEEGRLRVDCSGSLLCSSTSGSSGGGYPGLSIIIRDGATELLRTGPGIPYYQYGLGDAAGNQSVNIAHNDTLPIEWAGVTRTLTVELGGRMVLVSGPGNTTGAAVAIGARLGIEFIKR